MSASPVKLVVPHGPNFGKTIKAPYGFNEIVNNSEDRDLIITVLSLVLPAQDPKEIHVKVVQTDIVYKILFFNGSFSKETQATISEAFSSVIIKKSNYPEFTVMKALSFVPMYYDTELIATTESGDISRGCLVVEVLKDWRSIVNLSYTSSYHTPTAKERSRDIMSQKPGKISKSTKFKHTELAVRKSLDQRSLITKVLDGLLGVKKTQIEQQVLANTDD